MLKYLKNKNLKLEKRETDQEEFFTSTHPSANPLKQI